MAGCDQGGSDRCVYPYLNTADNDIVKVYNIQAFPTKILVSPTGEILGRWEGEAPELDRMLEKIFFK